MYENAKLLEKHIDNKLVPLSFKKIDSNFCLNENNSLTIWSMKNWNRNIGIVLFNTPDVDFVKIYNSEFKKKLIKKIGYFYIFFPVGLQIILYGKNLSAMQDSIFLCLDKYNQPKIVLQSISLVDLQEKMCYSAETWGQYSNRKYLDAIANAIDNFLEDKRKI